MASRFTVEWLPGPNQFSKTITGTTKSTDEYVPWCLGNIELHYARDSSARNGDARRLVASLLIYSGRFPLWAGAESRVVAVRISRPSGPRSMVDVRTAYRRAYHSSYAVTSRSRIGCIPLPIALQSSGARALRIRAPRRRPKERASNGPPARSCVRENALRAAPLMHLCRVILLWLRGLPRPSSRQADLTAIVDVRSTLTRSCFQPDSNAPLFPSVSYAICLCHLARLRARLFTTACFQRRVEVTYNFAIRFSRHGASAL